MVQQGSFSYTSPEGKLITIHYTADETGFHATGDHIPTPPPVSEEIQKGLDLIFAGIRQQEVRPTTFPFLIFCFFLSLFLILSCVLFQFDLHFLFFSFSFYSFILFYISKKYTYINYIR